MMGRPRGLFDIFASADPETPPAHAAERFGDQIVTIVVARDRSS
jgi:hypothetical protein